MQSEKTKNNEKTQTPEDSAKVEEALDAGEREKRFRELIEGEFKDLYEESVERIGRIKDSSLAPALKTLAAKYGVDENDAEALSAAIMDENSPEKARELLSKKESLARRQYEKWIEEAGEAGRVYEQFSLERELCNEQFKELLMSGVPVKSSYELIHRRELMEDYAQKLTEDITGRILAGTLRPKEGALGGTCAAGFVSDVSRMSKSARREIIKRVQKGEKISF